jgi:hypothetical protein
MAAVEVVVAASTATTVVVEPGEPVAVDEVVSLSGVAGGEGLGAVEVAESSGRATVVVTEPLPT